MPFCLILFYCFWEISATNTKRAYKHPNERKAPEEEEEAEELLALIGVVERRETPAPAPGRHRANEHNEKQANSNL